MLPVEGLETAMHHEIRHPPPLPKREKIVQSIQPRPSPRSRTNYCAAATRLPRDQNVLIPAITENQDPGRQDSAEATEASEELARQLVDPEAL